jgi:restriction system protein
MPLPQFAAYINPVLATLQKLGGSARPSEVIEEVAAQLAVPDSVREERLSDGKPRFDNQIHWARHYLADTGYIDRSRRGVWTLTDKGQQVKELSDTEIRGIVNHVQARSRGEVAYTASVSAQEPIAAESTDASPETVTGDYREQLLHMIRTLPPTGFERLCQRLLRESGFEQVTVTGRSGDGGIDGDGLFLVNKFVSFRVLFQCKRYQGSVGSSTIRDFRGAMMGRAEKGIILTTGTFTPDARREARRDGAPPLELVDGERLVDLFEELELGLKPRTTYDVDHTFFDDYRQP